MPPKVRIEKSDILREALTLVRENGADALNARSLAARLGCSTQPIFCNFTGMGELFSAVIDEAERFYHARTEKEIAEGGLPPYKAMGMAYIRFAAEERELFRLLFMRDRAAENIGEGDGEGFWLPTVQRATGLSPEAARLFHLEMWAAVHGIAVMLATGYLALDLDLVSRMLTDIYRGLSHRFESEGS